MRGLSVVLGKERTWQTSRARRSAIITNEKAHQRNKACKSELKIGVRRVREAVAAGNGAEAYAAALAASRLLDKAASKGIIHKNQAANRKSVSCSSPTPS